MEIGKRHNSIDKLKLKEEFLMVNTMVIASPGAGKWTLVKKIQKYCKQMNQPVIYINFSERNNLVSDENDFTRLKYRDGEDFKKEFEKALRAKEDILFHADVSFFKESELSINEVTKLISHKEMLASYYIVIEEMGGLSPLYEQHEAFYQHFLYMYQLKTFGLLFVSKPCKLFFDGHFKRFFSQQFLGYMPDTRSHILGTLKKNEFLYRVRIQNDSYLFDDVSSGVVSIFEK